jgi:hypothetical protein
MPKMHIARVVSSTFDSKLNEGTFMVFRILSPYNY